jgi:predicted ribosome quality control (RQC) complex YloA/Tae2 family protein
MLRDYLTNNIVKTYEKRLFGVFFRFKQFNIYFMNHLKRFESKKDKFPDIQKKEIDGFTIFIGRDAKSNDYLTFNVADKEDIWMHIKGKPGSHIVIRVRENLPTPEIIKIAADLAKRNSKAKNDNSATIVYCQRKFVKKEPGMNDGQVKVDYKNAEEITI